jgi:pimeloyl-ACP methyl ester carboxylesterase
VGGKVATAAALAAPRAVEKLVVADIAPAPTTISPAYSVYVQAMENMQEMDLRSRKDAHAVLRETESVCRCDASVSIYANGAPRRTRPCSHGYSQTSRAPRTASYASGSRSAFSARASATSARSRERPVSARGEARRCSLKARRASA